jgi:hypothetical protein
MYQIETWKEAAEHSVVTTLEVETQINRHRDIAEHKEVAPPM